MYSEEENGFGTLKLKVAQLRYMSTQPCLMIPAIPAPRLGGGIESAKTTVTGLPRAPNTLDGREIPQSYMFGRFFSFT